MISGRKFRSVLFWFFPLLSGPLLFFYGVRASSVDLRSLNHRKLRLLVLSPGGYAYVFPLGTLDEDDALDEGGGPIPERIFKVRFAGKNSVGPFEIWNVEIFRFSDGRLGARLISSAEQPPIFKKLSLIRSFYRSRLLRMPLYERNLFLSLIFGERTSLKRDFARAGLAHLLVVSGLHFVVFFLIFRSIVSVLVWISGLELSYAWEAAFDLFLSVLAFVFFLTFAGFTPSIFRAFLMIVFSSLARMTGRSASLFRILVYSMGVSCIFFYVDLSFLYTFLAVASFVPLDFLNRFSRTKPSSFSEKLGFYFLGTSLPFFFTSPLSFHYFGKVYPTGLLLNPLIGLIFPFLMLAGFLYVLTGTSGYLATVLSSAFNSIVFKFSSSAFTLKGYTPLWLLGVFVASEFTIFFIEEGVTLRAPIRKFFREGILFRGSFLKGTILFSLTLPLLLFAFSVGKKPKMDNIKVIFMGPSSYPVVFVKDGEAVVVNPGSRRHSGDLCHLLERKGVKAVKAVFITNPRRAGGIIDTLGSLKIENFFDVALYARGAKDYEDILEFVSREKINYRVLRRGFGWNFGKMKFECIYPPGKLAFGVPNMDEAVIRVSYCGKSMILMGGLSSQAQPLLVDLARKELKALLIESSYPPRRELLSRVSPKLVIVSSYIRRELPGKFLKTEGIVELEFPSLKYSLYEKGYLDGD